MKDLHVVSFHSTASTRTEMKDYVNVYAYKPNTHFSKYLFVNYLSVWIVLNEF